MTFLFNFGGPDPAETPSVPAPSTPSIPQAPAKELPLEALSLSQTVIGELVPATNPPLYKRHVSDVKFEVASTDDTDEGEENVIAHAIVAGTDLIKGVYEGAELPDTRSV
ncbi:hypothetical protein HK097_003453 [Rhizophlyctis rosea]|uniref:Uncharacterized protein n=1 Tax=Rhizophlyctis rosea TaxID=64517 RepID=A0AAD5SMC8_9FUNG|nr:hypothetical protein HK097_003453 [Rhizophlyctis rosea]